MSAVSVVLEEIRTANRLHSFLDEAVVRSVNVDLSSLKIDLRSVCDAEMERYINLRQAVSFMQPESLADAAGMLRMADTFCDAPMEIVEDCEAVRRIMLSVAEFLECRDAGRGENRVRLLELVKTSDAPKAQAVD